MPGQLGGFSRLQTSTLAILFVSLLLGLVVKTWRFSRPLPEIDPKLEQRFIAISDSLARRHNDAEGDLNAPQILVDLNNATLEELQMLPSVGPVLAARIIQYRAEHGRFQDKAELMRVKGIGKKTLEKLSTMIIIRKDD